uniref:Putative very acidic protein n=2 Tax=Rhodnius prolixus TaxID=13249 RepID=R4G7Z4_RHOPR
MDKLDLTMSNSANSKARQQMQNVRKELKGRTHFHDFEAERLLHMYWKMTQIARMNVVEFQFFLYHVFGMTNSYMIKLIYNFLKEKKLTEGHSRIGPAQFVIMLSIFCRGSLEEKISFAFRVYDQGAGFLSEETVMKYIRRTFYKKGMQNRLIDYEPKEYFSYILQMFDPYDEKKISYNRFKEAILEQPPLLQALGQIFPDRLAVYTFLTTFTHLVTTHHVKFIYEKETDTAAEGPAAREKNLLKLQMAPFSQDHLNEIFNKIIEEASFKVEERESEVDEDEEQEVVKQVNILDDEDIDEYIYDDEDYDEEDLMEDDEVESIEAGDEEEVIVEEEVSEEEEMEKEVEAVTADSTGVELEVQDELKELSMDLDEKDSSTSDEEFEDATETIDLGREDLLLEVSSSYECGIESMGGIESDEEIIGEEESNTEEESKEVSGSEETTVDDERTEECGKDDTTEAVEEKKESLTTMSEDDFEDEEEKQSFKEIDFDEKKKKKEKKTAADKPKEGDKGRKKMGRRKEVASVVTEELETDEDEME